MPVRGFVDAVAAVALAVLLTLGAGPARATEAARPLRMAYADNLPPLAYQEQGRMRGAWVAVMDELARRLQLSVEHRGYPWARAQLMVSAGEADGMLTSANPERLGYALAGSESVLENGTRIFVHKSNARIDELAAVRQVDELRKFNLVSYLGNGWLKTNLPDARVRWLRTLDDAVRAAALEENVVLVEGERLLWPALHRRQLEDEFIMVGPLLEQTATRLLIGRKSPYAARLADLDKALAAMRRDGTLKQILAAHGVD